MHQRIREIVEAAGIKCDAYGYTLDGGPPVDIGKLTELLVIECSKWVECEVVPDGLYWSKKLRRCYGASD